MPLQFMMFASGSSGNAGLLNVDGFAVLIDAGLGPRQFARRLMDAGSSWPQVRAVLLTHTHGDHWKERTFARLGRLRIPLYCHADHHEHLLAASPAYAELHSGQLAKQYETEQELVLSPRLRCRPLPLCHDGGATFGFRFEADAPGQARAVAYLADLGCWTAELARSLGDVDVLALEFNHDVAMEHASGRSPQLIARVLGDEGHLSNEQAAAFLDEIVRRSAPGRLRHLVQLHLSRDCNRPALAVLAARAILDRHGVSVEIHTALQHQTGPVLNLDGPILSTIEPGRTAPGPVALASAPGRQETTAAIAAARVQQPWLPGLEA